VKNKFEKECDDCGYREPQDHDGSEVFGCDCKSINKVNLDELISVIDKELRQWTTFKKNS
jgi:hypothetical protein